MANITFLAFLVGLGLALLNYFWYKVFFPAQKIIKRNQIIRALWIGTPFLAGINFFYLGRAYVMSHFNIPEDSLGVDIYLDVTGALWIVTLFWFGILPGLRAKYGLKKLF